VLVERKKEYPAFRLRHGIECCPETVSKARYFFLQLLLAVTLDRKQAWLRVPTLNHLCKVIQYLMVSMFEQCFGSMCQTA
jgi:hypothetical protein